jgi:N-acetyl-gamma-glutamylphosphate reductase
MSVTVIPPTGRDSGADDAAQSRGAPASAPATAPAAAPATAPATARIALFGASGYTGQEFARLALSHPGLELAAMVSREHAGEPVANVFAGWDARSLGASFVAPDAIEAMIAAGACDTIVACMPHGAWRTMLAESPSLAAGLHAAESGATPLRVVDLSSDHRDG